MKDDNRIMIVFHVTDPSFFEELGSISKELIDRGIIKDIREGDGNGYPYLIRHGDWGFTKIAGHGWNFQFYDKDPKKAVEALNVIRKSSIVKDVYYFSTNYESGEDSIYPQETNELEKYIER